MWALFEMASLTRYDRILRIGMPSSARHPVAPRIASTAPWHTPSRFRRHYDSCDDSADISTVYLLADTMADTPSHVMQILQNEEIAL